MDSLKVRSVPALGLAQVVVLLALLGPHPGPLGSLQRSLFHVFRCQARECYEYRLGCARFKVSRSWDLAVDLIFMPTCFTAAEGAGSGAGMPATSPTVSSCRKSAEHSNLRQHSTPPKMQSHRTISTLRRDTPLLQLCSSCCPECTSSKNR